MWGAVDIPFTTCITGDCTDAALVNLNEPVASLNRLQNESEGDFNVVFDDFIAQVFEEVSRFVDDAELVQGQGRVLAVRAKAAIVAT